MAKRRQIGQKVPKPATPSPDPSADWKVAALQPVAGRAVAVGREVYWIEDFCGALPDVRLVPEGVGYIDIGDDGTPPVPRPEIGRVPAAWAVVKQTEADAAAVGTPGPG